MTDTPREQQIRERLEQVKEAARNNEVDVFKREHHASWTDIEDLLSALTALRSELEQVRQEADSLGAAWKERSDSWKKRTKSAEASLAEVRQQLTRSQYEVQALGQILHDVEGQLAAERDEFSTLLRSQILISETKNTLLRKRLAQQDETLNGLVMKWRDKYGWNIDARAAFKRAADELEALLSPPTQESHDDGLSETERRHATDCRQQEAQRQRDADALQAGFELGRAPQEPQ